MPYIEVKEKGLREKIIDDFTKQIDALLDNPQYGYSVLFVEDIEIIALRLPQVPGERK